MPVPKLHASYIVILVALLALTATATVSSPASDDIAFTSSLGSGATYFTENRGQWDERVLFKADGAGGLTWFIERDGATLLFSVPDPIDDSQRMKRMGHEPFDHLSASSASSAENYRAHALKFRFQNTNPSRAGRFLPDQVTSAVADAVEPAERLTWNNNYFLGNDQSKWAPDCGNFQRVTLKNVWDGIDVTWRTVGKHVEFDFVVQPGADVSLINVACLGLTGDLSSTSDGEELLLPTSLGVLRQSIPEAYQIDSNGSYSSVRAQFAISDDGGRFGLSIPEGYHPGRTLVVDPLVYSTYLGGSSRDYADALASDGEEGLIVVGYTFSGDFPTTEGVLDRSANGGEYDAFAARLSRDGNELLYSTYIGGGKWDCAESIVLDGAGGVILAGYTSSGDFPISEGAFDGSYNGGVDVFIARLNGDGRELLISTYLGGSDIDNAFAVLPDGNGGVFVAGYTYSSDFPTSLGAFKSLYVGPPNYSDAFIARFSGDDLTLFHGTYFGGNKSDEVRALAPDGLGGVFIAGTTSSYDLPSTEGVYKRERSGASDNFVIRVNGDLSNLYYCTYFGGSNNDEVRSLATGGDNEVVIAGRTRSTDLPTTAGVFSPAKNGGEYDAYVARLTFDLTEIVFSTYLGGKADDFVNALLCSEAGDIFVAGYTNSDNFPITPSALDTSFNGGHDVFVARLSGDGSRILNSTYLGGDSLDFATSSAFDGEAGVIIAGTTYSTNFPTTIGAFDRSFNGSIDAFVTRLDLIDPAFVYPDTRQSLPTTLSLSSPYPNPFNARTKIDYALPQATDFTLSVFDINGRLVATLVDGRKVAGYHTAEWNAVGVPSGLYFARLKMGGKVQMRKMMLVK